MNYCNASKLRNIQCNLEKSEKILLDNLSKYEENVELVDMAKEFSTQIKKEEAEIMAQIENIMRLRQNVKILIYKDNERNKTDIEALKDGMVLIQTNIQNLQFSAKTQLEFLKQEEDVLTDEVNSFEQKLREWTRPLKYFSTTNYKLQKSASAKPHMVSQEIEDFMNYIASNKGHENGWSTDDHQLFLKMRQKFTTQEALANNLHALLPDISIEEILAHEKWYVKYNELKTKYKKVISSWRQTKSATVSNNRKENPVGYCNQENLSSKKNIKRKLDEWKIDKQESLLRQKQFEIQRKLKEKEAAQLQKQKNEEMKKMVADWKYSKLVSVQKEKLNYEMKQLEIKRQKIAEANKMIKLYQLQDQQYIQKIKQNHLQKNNDKVRIRKNDKDRDPAHVLKPTKQWLSRIKKVNNSSEAKSNIDLTLIPKLGTPLWRKSVS